MPMLSNYLIIPGLQGRKCHIEFYQNIEFIGSFMLCSEVLKIFMCQINLQSFELACIDSNKSSNFFTVIIFSLSVLCVNVRDLSRLVTSYGLIHLFVSPIRRYLGICLQEITFAFDLNLVLFYLSFLKFRVLFLKLIFETRGLIYSLHSIVYRPLSHLSFEKRAFIDFQIA